jgi:hypothetical protein
VESKIEPHDDLDDESNVEFEVQKCTNFKVQSSEEIEVSTNENFQFAQKDQDSPH